MNAGGNPFGKPLGKAHFGPLAPCPVRPLRYSLLESRERKAQQHHESELVLEEINHNMRRGIIAGKNFVQWEQGTEVQVSALAKLAADLVHMSVELFEEALKTI